MSPKPIRRLAIVANRTKPGVDGLAGDLASVAQGAGVEVVLPPTYPLPAGALVGCDACLVLGGDGTLLGVVAEAVAARVPVLGINRGKLGFLACYDSENAAEDLRGVLRGDYKAEERVLLEARSQCGSSTIALNDVVIRPAAHTHLVRLHVSLDDEFVNAFPCDGLIVATPTGSTAYNLAAGGPLIAPHAGVFALTPICPHTLSNRSLIFSDKRVLTIDREPGRADLRLDVVADGTPHFQATASCFPLRISLAVNKIRLIQPPTISHFKVLRNKLRWA
ncbi:MAG: NAD(+)/NADH kinase [Puniceicoccales bacterium]|jgi:NAD+ kinase|nr:NAD(+)/NADH kinase [Puniceicoccales bacterium]